MKAEKRRWWVSLTMLGLAACSGNGLPRPQNIQTRVALESFSSCGELQKYIADTAVLEMRSQLEQMKQGGGVMFAAGGGTPAPDGRAGADSSGPSSFTTTNTQVAGVDEADFVKNDGTRIFVLSGNKLYLNRSWPPNQLQTMARLEIEGWPREMFLDEQNHIVVFSTIYTPYPLAQGAGWPAAAVSCARMDCAYRYGNSTKVTLVDVADLGNPRVEKEFFFPGYYASSRRIASSVRIVLSDQFRWPAEVKWFPDYNGRDLYQDRRRWERALDDLMARNEVVIRQQPLDAWLPRATRKLADGSLANLEYRCSDFSKTNGPTRLGLITVATLNPDRPDQLAQTSIIAEPGQIYASTRSLYVASRHWWWSPETGQKDHTYLHKLDISSPEKATYVASGGVGGHIVDQFSMDEDPSERFRVATNLSTRVSDSASPWGRLNFSNRVSVLAEANGRLEVIGQTEELSPGERIFSSRFVGDKGFVVTFRQVDPFFTLDLSDPAHPKKVGELKVPGFSSYIHPIDDRYLLTIGQYVPENGDWRFRAVKLSVFDVSDFANPIERFTQLVGTSRGWTEAAFNHKAFNYFPAKKLLAIPFSDYDPLACGTYWCGFVSDLRIFHIDGSAGISPVGAIRMNDVYQTIGIRDWSYSWAPWIRRSVMADDFAYAISDAGIRVADVGSPSSPIRTVLFDPRN